MNSYDSYKRGFSFFDRPFFHYLEIKERKLVKTQSFTRGEFWNLSSQLSCFLQGMGIQKGDCLLHCFGKNHYGDALLRLAAIFVGSVPVTINWQADLLERIFYKIESANPKTLFFDSSFDSDDLKEIEKKFPELKLINIDSLLKSLEPKKVKEFPVPILDLNDPKMIIFTSGTTGKPKGVQLTYKNYKANYETFESFLELKNHPFHLFLVNPFHHSNTSSFFDLALRSSHCEVFLLEKYTSDYWETLSELSSRSDNSIFAPCVSRHFDFLEGLDLKPEKLNLKGVTFVIGSAPVGPKTIEIVRKWTGHFPTVRFGSTETCLQLLGTPSNKAKNFYEDAFKRGVNGQNQLGFYIGRPHIGHTEVRIVKSVNKLDPQFMKDCVTSELGYLVAKGNNIMLGYLNDPEKTKSVFWGGYYLGLGDKAYYLINEEDGEKDFYWVARDANMIIKGGANYSYTQIEDEISKVLIREYQWDPNQFNLSAIGFKKESEHEDSLGVSIEIQEKSEKKNKDLDDFQKRMAELLTKGARPDFIRLGLIPKNFKGAVINLEHRKIFLEYLSLAEVP